MIDVIEADLSLPAHAEAVVRLLHAYALDPMGGSEGLSEFAQANLISELRRRPWMRAVLAYAEGEPAGLAICIEGFSTFACKPLLNIHDLAVAPQFRGRGIAKLLLRRSRSVARQRWALPITWKSPEGNTIAQSAYRACGYAGYELDPKLGRAMFWQNKLT